MADVLLLHPLESGKIFIGMPHVLLREVYSIKIII